MGQILVQNWRIMSLSEVKNRKNVQNCETEKLMEKRRKQSVRGTETEYIQIKIRGRGNWCGQGRGDGGAEGQWERWMWEEKGESMMEREHKGDRKKENIWITRNKMNKKVWDRDTKPWLFNTPLPFQVVSYLSKVSKILKLNSVFLVPLWKEKD